MTIQGFMTASAPGSHCGSRRGSNAGIFIEPEQNPESYGRIFFYAFKMALAITFLHLNAVETIQISLLSIHDPLC